MKIIGAFEIIIHNCSMNWFKKLFTTSINPQASSREPAESNSGNPAIDAILRSENNRSLGAAGDNHAVESLIAELKHGNPIVRSSAASALGDLGDARAVEPLIATLNDNDQGVIAGAALSLAKIPDQRAVEPLIATLLIARVNRNQQVVLSVSMALMKLMVAGLIDKERLLSLTQGSPNS